MPKLAVHTSALWCAEASLFEAWLASAEEKMEEKKKYNVGRNGNKMVPFVKPWF